MATAVPGAAGADRPRKGQKIGISTAIEVAFVSNGVSRLFHETARMSEDGFQRPPFLRPGYSRGENDSSGMGSSRTLRGLSASSATFVGVERVHHGAYSS